MARTMTTARKSTGGKPPRPPLNPSKDEKDPEPLSSSTAVKQEEKEQDAEQSIKAESSETSPLSRTRSGGKRKKSDATDDVGQAGEDVQKEGQQKDEEKPSPKKRRQTHLTDFQEKPGEKEHRQNEEQAQAQDQKDVDEDSKAAKQEERQETKQSANKQEEGQETKLSVGGDAWQVVERGIIHFVFRPKVQSAEDASSDAPAAESFDDIQRTHMILLPKNSDDTHDTHIAWRQITLGKKRMPKPEAALAQGQEPGGIGGSHSEAIWATVAEVGDNLEDISDNLKETKNQTKTRGLRVNGSARPAGRGHYLLSIRQAPQASQREVRLSYYLSHPSEQEFGPVQEALGLEAPCSSIIMQMRNPTLPQTGPSAPPAGLPAEKRVELSDEQMKETFGGAVKESGEGEGNRYGRPERMDLLDSSGVELLLIAKDAKTEEHDVAADAEQKQEMKKLAEKDAAEKDDADVLKELGMSAKEFPVDALSGKWI